MAGRKEEMRWWRSEGWGLLRERKWGGWRGELVEEDTDADADADTGRDVLGALLGGELGRRRRVVTPEGRERERKRRRVGIEVL